MLLPELSPQPLSTQMARLPTARLSASEVWKLLGEEPQGQDGTQGTDGTEHDG